MTSEDTGRVLRSGHVYAARDHLYSACGALLPEGYRHLYLVELEEGRFRTSRLCAPCERPDLYPEREPR